MEFLFEYGLFLAKAVTVVLAVTVAIAAACGMLGRGRGGPPATRLQVEDLGRRYRDLARTLEHAVETRRGWRERLRGWRGAARGADLPGAGARRVFVLDFDGDVRASAVDSLREEINAIVSQVRPDDEVVLRLESGGGLVPGYGLAASQLERLRTCGIKLVVAVDRIAASGGYMMACVGDRILAAPFAVIGSIGVVAQLPNLHRWLQHRDVDYEMFTAGEHKRTVTVFGANTEEGRKKFQEELDEAHRLFKDWVRRQRPAMDIDRLATGEYWLGSRALTLGLVDELGTSDDYLLRASREARVLRLRYRARRSLGERLLHGVQTVFGAIGAHRKP